MRAPARLAAQSVDGVSGRSYRVMVGHREVRVEGATTVYEQVWEEATLAQAQAYAAGDPAWREAKASVSKLLERPGLFQRLQGWFLR